MMMWWLALLAYWEKKFGRWKNPYVSSGLLLEATRETRVEILFNKNDEQQNTTDDRYVEPHKEFFIASSMLRLCFVLLSDASTIKRTKLSIESRLREEVDVRKKSTPYDIFHHHVSTCSWMCQTRWEWASRRTAREYAKSYRHYGLFSL